MLDPVVLTAYRDRLRRFGPTAQAVWMHEESRQLTRLEVMLECCDATGRSIADVGCGLGALLAALRVRPALPREYVGYDVVPEMVGWAGTLAGGWGFPVRFVCRDVSVDGLEEDADVSVVSGVLNDRRADNWDFATRLLRLVWAQTSHALVVNGLSSYVDYCEPDLWYVDPAKVFTWVKSTLTPCVQLRHDYVLSSGPYEWTILARRVPYPLRQQVTPCG